MEEELRLRSLRATIQEGTELPLQPTGLNQWNLKAQDNVSQSTGSLLTPISARRHPALGCDTLSPCRALESALDENHVVEWSQWSGKGSTTTAGHACAKMGLPGTKL